jgi:hypothetical protein
MRFMLAVFLVSHAVFVHAQDLGQLQPIAAMFYWEKPLDASSKRDAASAFGFRLDRAPVVNSVVFRKPILDVRFNQQGFHSLAFRGSVLHQNQPASGGPSPEVNWWLIGGITLGAAIVINNERKNRSSAEESRW